MAVYNYERNNYFLRGNNPCKGIKLINKHRAIVQFILSCAYSNKRRMVYDINWIIPKLRQPPSRLWRFASTLTFFTVGIFSKIIIRK